LPERVESAARERIAASTYQTLVFGVVNGDKSGIPRADRADEESNIVPHVALSGWIAIALALRARSEPGSGSV
jgi:hypothetical protein